MSAMVLPQTDTKQVETKDLTMCRKCMIGGLGALMPILLNLIVIDTTTLLKNFTLIAAIGYLIRCVGFFGAGAAVAFLHKDEKAPVKLFELGILAPALILGMLNGKKATDVNPDLKASNVTATQTVGSFSLLPQAFAATPPKVASAEREARGASVVREGAPNGTRAFAAGLVALGVDELSSAKKFRKPEESATAQFWRGLTGLEDAKVWFVVAASHQNAGDARRIIEEINRRYQGFRAEAYHELNDEQHYAVVLAANLTLSDARDFKRKAVNAGIKDADLKNPWQ